MKAIVHLGEGQPKIIVQAENSIDESIVQGLEGLMPSVLPVDCEAAAPYRSIITRQEDKKRRCLIIEMQQILPTAMVAAPPSQLSKVIREEFGDRFGETQTADEDIAVELIKEYAKLLRKRSRGVTSSSRKTRIQSFH